MKLSSPLPQPLPKECAKAAKIFKSFVDSSNNGLDGVIPREILQHAKGFAIFTIFKAGFLFSARAGTGIVIAKLADGTWSSPSAIGTAGLGVGGQLGAEMTDFLIVLNSRSAVKSFMASGSLSLGGNMSLALGPLGRNGEAIGALNTSGKVAAMYSYSKTRGLFGGLSLEGSVIVERQDANAQAYGSNVTAKLLLGGAVTPPPWASPLITTLEACTGLPGNRQWIEESEPSGGYAFTTPTSETPPTSTSLRKKRKGDQKADFPPTSWGEPRDGGSYFSQQVEAASLRGKPQYDSPFDPWDSSDAANFSSSSSTSQFPTQFKSDWVPDKPQQLTRASTLSHKPSPFTPSSKDTGLTRSTSQFSTKFQSDWASNEPYRHSRAATSAHSGSYDLFDPTPAPASTSLFGDDDDTLSMPSHSRSMSASPFSSGKTTTSPTSGRATPFLKTKPELSRPLLPHEGVARAIALYDFQAVQPGDLSFSKGDVIVITKKSESTDDWWTGTVPDGKKGIFPANFVEVVGM